MKQFMLVASAGGHLAELQKLALANHPDSIVITEKTDSINNPNYKYLRYGTRSKIFVYPFIFMSNFMRAMYYLLRYRPKYLISTGAHSCVPFFIIAKTFPKRSIKTIYIESFAKVNSPSMTYNFIKNYCDVVIVQHQELLDIYPNSVYLGGVY